MYVSEVTHCQGGKFTQSLYFASLCNERWLTQYDVAVTHGYGPNDSVTMHVTCQDATERLPHCITTTLHYVFFRKCANCNLV